MGSYFVDPANGIDMPIATGTIANPWRSVQYALDNIVRNTSTGDQINLRSTAADVLSATLDTSTYGSTASNVVGLAIVGYDNAENDGGFGILDGNDGGFPIFDGTIGNQRGHMFRELELRNCGTAACIFKHAIYGHINHCWLHGCDNRGIDAVQTLSYVTDCLIDDVGTVGIYRASVADGNHIRQTGARTMTAAIETLTHADHNYISINGTTDGIHTLGAIHTGASGNTIISDGGTGKGIHDTSARGGQYRNNRIKGFSGVGGVGFNVRFPALARGNVVSDCETLFHADALNRSGDIDNSTTDGDIDVSPSSFINGPNRGAVAGAVQSGGGGTTIIRRHAFGLGGLR